MKGHRTGRSPMKTVLFTLAAVILIAAFAAGCAYTGAKDGDADRTEKPAPTSEQAEAPEAASALPDTGTAAPTASPDAEADLSADRAFPWQREGSTVPDVFSIASNDYPSRYDLTLEERTALWEMLRAVHYTPVDAESIHDEIDPYSDQYSLTGTYEGYYRISWYYEGAASFGNAQLYPENIISAGDWYRYDADSFDMELLQKICDVPQTLYPKTDEEIRAASTALQAFWEGRGGTVERIWFDEAVCSAYMNDVLHAGPAGQRTKAKAEDTIVLLMDTPDGTEIRSEFALLHRAESGAWEFVGNYPR